MSRLAAAAHRWVELPRFHQDEPSLQRPVSFSFLEIACIDRTPPARGGTGMQSYRGRELRRTLEETIMLRKFGLAAAAAASLAAAALAPTSASAWGGHGWHRGWHGGHLGGSPRFRRWPGLWLRWLLHAAIGPDPLGTALAHGKPLLLSTIIRSERQQAPARHGGGFVWGSKMEPAGSVSCNSCGNAGNRPARRNNFQPDDLVLHHDFEMSMKRNSP
jgi:hypothetical protein